MDCKPLSLLKSCLFCLLMLCSFNAFAQYYVVYPASKKNIDYVYCYKVQNTVAKKHKGGAYSIEVYTLGTAAPCSASWVRCKTNACAECSDPWQSHANDNLYAKAYYYEDFDETYDEDGRTGDDGAADLNIDH